MCFLLSRTIRDQYVFHFSMSNRLSDRYPGRGVLNTPPARLSSTPSPLAGRLVGRMLLRPTLPEKDEISSGRYYLLSRTIRYKYVFHSIMSNRLSDRYPGRGVLHTPHNHSQKGYLIACQTIVGRMQCAPTLPAEKSDLKGWREVMSETRGDESVFHSIMSNRLSDKYPGRGVLHTPLNHSRKGYLITRQTIWGRMQYAPTLPAEKSDLKGWWEVMFETMGDKPVFHSIMSNRLSDRYPGRAQKNTPHIDSTSTRSPLAERIEGVCNTPLPCRKKIRFP